MKHVPTPTMETNMKTTLEAYCEIVGWQGGTIHQAHSDFLNRSQLERDQIIGKLVDGKREITDIDAIIWFTSANIGHLEFTIVKMKEV